VNYYDHHIKDYDAATAHLSWDEDMAYTRLIRWYYRKERPIPADLAEACRQVRAHSAKQREAVEAVLREFFVLQDDGWHKDDCDDAIERFQAGEPEREAKKKNEDTRLARHRAERAELFTIINGAGLHMSWNCPMGELRAAAERIRTGSTRTPETPPPPETATPPATAPATPATATQYPLPTTHSPVPNIESGGVPPAPTPAPTPPPPPPAPAAPAPAQRKKGGSRAEAAPDEPLEGERQRSSRPYRQCPPTFRLTRAMAQWASDNYPLLSLDAITRETRAFMNHRYDRGYVEWTGAWENWIKRAGDKLAERATPRNGGSFQTFRERQAAEAVPGIAQRPAVRTPGTPLIDVEDVTDAEPRTPLISNG